MSNVGQSGPLIIIGSLRPLPSPSRGQRIRKGEGNKRKPDERKSSPLANSSALAASKFAQNSPPSSARQQLQTRVEWRNCCQNIAPKHWQTIPALRCNFHLFSAVRSSWLQFCSQMKCSPRQVFSIRGGEILAARQACASHPELCRAAQIQWNSRNLATQVRRNLARKWGLLVGLGRSLSSGLEVANLAQLERRGSTGDRFGWPKRRRSRASLSAP